MSAEDLVAEWEKTGVATVNLDELKALCASWREQRGALKEARPYVQGMFNTLKHTNEAHIPHDVLAKIDAALKDKL